MRQVIERDKIQSVAISNAAKNNPEIDSYALPGSAANVDSSEELEDEDTEEEAEEHQLKEQQSS